MGDEVGGSGCLAHLCESCSSTFQESSPSLSEPLIFPRRLPQPTFPNPSWVQRSFPRRFGVLGGARARNRTCDTYCAKDLSAGLTNATNRSDGYNPICVVLIVFQCQLDLFRDPSRVIMGANVCASLRWRGRFLTNCKSLNLNVTGCTCNAKSPIIIKNW